MTPHRWRRRVHGRLRHYRMHGDKLMKMPELSRGSVYSMRMLATRVGNATELRCGSVCSLTLRLII